MTPCYYCEADDDACKTCIHSDTYIDPQEEITKLREQVAAQAAVIEKLTKWLNIERSYYLEAGSDIAEDVCDYLHHPTDSTQILDEVRRAERERSE